MKAICLTIRKRIVDKSDLRANMLGVSWEGYTHEYMREKENNQNMWMCNEYGI